MGVLIGLLVTILLHPYIQHAAAQTPACNCATIYNPVCANNSVTYGNACLLGCENKIRAARNETALTATNGECPCICTAIYRPVCANNRNTYGNTCSLSCENKRRAARGLNELYIEYIVPCSCVYCNCSNQWQPVCGSDRRTYPNYCWLGCYDRCNRDSGYPGIYFSKYGYC